MSLNPVEIIMPADTIFARKTDGSGETLIVVFSTNLEVLVPQDRDTRHTVWFHQ